jgi:hypothetical protein
VAYGHSNQLSKAKLDLERLLSFPDAPAELRNRTSEELWNMSRQLALKTTFELRVWSLGKTGSVRASEPLPPAGIRIGRSRRIVLRPKYILGVVFKFLLPFLDAAHRSVSWLF